MTCNGNNNHPTHYNWMGGEKKKKKSAKKTLYILKKTKTKTVFFKDESVHCARQKHHFSLIAKADKGCKNHTSDK